MAPGELIENSLTGLEAVVLPLYEPGKRRHGNLTQRLSGSNRAYYQYTP